jgi:hypothetical protein
MWTFCRWTFNCHDVIGGLDVRMYAYYSGNIQTHCQKNKKIKRADQILPEVYGITLRSVNSNKKQISTKPYISTVINIKILTNSNQDSEL